MNDMTATIAPKSDQLNADDLIGLTKTITITSVSIQPGAEQPVSISFEGDNRKPYKPGKSMRRVLVTQWGPDASAYAGRRLTLYRDEEVAFGGLKVGGIRISHMSDIPGKVTMALTATRGNKKAFTVQPLRAEQPKPPQAQQSGETALANAEAWLAPINARLAAVTDQDEFNEVMQTPKLRPGLQAIERDFPALYATYEDARAGAMERIVPKHEPEYFEHEQAGEADA